MWKQKMRQNGHICVAASAKKSLPRRTFGTVIWLFWFWCTKCNTRPPLKACYRRLICDLATGQMPKSENDIIVKLFDGKKAPVTSPKFDFDTAAEVGKALKSVQQCELRYSCPLDGEQISKLISLRSWGPQVWTSFKFILLLFVEIACVSYLK